MQTTPDQLMSSCCQQTKQQWLLHANDHPTTETGLLLLLLGGVGWPISCCQSTGSATAQHYSQLSHAKGGPALLLLLLLSIVDTSNRELCVPPSFSPYNQYIPSTAVDSPSPAVHPFVLVADRHGILRPAAYAAHIGIHKRCYGLGPHTLLCIAVA